MVWFAKESNAAEGRFGIGGDRLLAEAPGLAAISIGVGVAYTVVAFRFWFVPAGVLAGLGTLCLAASAMLFLSF